MTNDFVSYGYGRNAGEFLQLPEYQYFQVELSNYNPSVLWSCELPAIKVITELGHRRTGRRPNAVVIVRETDFQDGRKTDEWVGKGTPAEIIDFVKSGEPNIAYIYIPFSELTAVWRRDALKFPGNLSQRAEMCLAYRNRNINFDVDFFARNSSPYMRLHSMEIVQSSRIIGRAQAGSGAIAIRTN